MIRGRKQKQREMDNQQEIIIVEEDPKDDVEWNRWAEA